MGSHGGSSLCVRTRFSRAARSRMMPWNRTGGNGDQPPGLGRRWRRACNTIAVRRPTLPLGKAPEFPPPGCPLVGMLSIVLVYNNIPHRSALSRDARHETNRDRRGHDPRLTAIVMPRLSHRSPERRGPSPPPPAPGFRSPPACRDRDVPVSECDRHGQAFNMVTIKSRVDGQIVKVGLPKAGRKAGSPLIQIDPRPFSRARPGDGD